MLHILDRFNQNIALKHNVESHWKSLNNSLLYTLYPIMKIILVLSGRYPQSETMDDTHHSYLLQ